MWNVRYTRRGWSNRCCIECKETVIYRAIRISDRRETRDVPVAEWDDAESRKCEWPTAEKKQNRIDRTEPSNLWGPLQRENRGNQNSRDNLRRLRLWLFAKLTAQISTNIYPPTLLPSPLGPEGQVADWNARSDSWKAEQIAFDSRRDRQRGDRGDLLRSERLTDRVPTEVLQTRRLSCR